jgi:hypothetical protein
LRAALALPAVAALLCAIASGLARLGVPVPDSLGALAGVHGALMIGGFFGTVIGLERAVALGTAWPYLAPLFSGLAALAMIAGHPSWAPAVLAVASLAMTAACASVWVRQKVAHHATLALAALAWLAGNLAWWWGVPTPAVVPAWAAFLILTIAGERLELTRFLPTPPWARRAFALIVFAVLAGALWPIALGGGGSRLFAAALLALALWLLAYDIARRTVRSEGLTRYMAVCLLSGYGWLGVGALFGLAGAFEAGHPARDAAHHAVLLGFVFSMVFGHAPIILPALTRLKLAWHRGFYAPLAVLHATLLLRVLAVLEESFRLRQAAAVGNAIALGLFLLLVATAVAAGRRKSADG